MSRFSDALRAAINARGWTQAEAARKTGDVSKVSMSRYLEGDDLPRRDSLESICKIFEPKVREEIAAAYALDSIPPSASGMVVVMGKSEAGEIPPLYEPDWPLPGSVNDRNLRIIARHIMKDPNLALVIDYLATTAEGLEPLGNSTAERVVLSVREQAEIEQARRQIENEEARGIYKTRKSAKGRPPKSK